MNPEYERLNKESIWITIDEYAVVSNQTRTKAMAQVYPGLAREKPDYQIHADDVERDVKPALIRYMPGKYPRLLKY